MSDDALQRALERALRAIDDDAPEYRAALDAIAANPGLMEQLRARPAQGHALFVELRKLRPLTLWVRDHAAVALACKRDFVLDGALCRIEPGAQLPPPEGRECWLEVDAAHAETTLRALPRGWGVLVSGELRQVSFAALRKLAPLRALGVVLAGEDATAYPLRLASLDSRLDLALVQDGASAGSEAVQAAAARVLWAIAAPSELQLSAPPIASSGAVCDGKQAPSWALCLATLRSSFGPAR